MVPGGREGLGRLQALPVTPVTLFPSPRVNPWPNVASCGQDRACLLLGWGPGGGWGGLGCLGP